MAGESELSVVEIQGQQNPELSPLNLPGSHDRIDLTNLSESTLAIDDVLNQQSGIQVRSLGGRGQFSYPAIRGASGKQLQLLWDGIPLTSLNGLDGSLPVVGMSSLQSIDIYRGIAPVELAPTAIGGTINLRSRQSNNSANPDEGSAYLSTGSFGYQAAGLWNNLQKEHWRLFTAAEYMQAENDFDIDGSSEQRENNAAQHAIATLRTDYSGWELWQPSLLIQHLYKKRELAGIRNHAANQAYLSESTNNLGLQLQYRASNKQKTDAFLNVYQSDELYDDQADNIGLGQQKNEYATQGINGRINHTLDFSQGQNVLTASVRTENSDADYLLKSDSTIETDCNSGNDCPYSYSRSQYQLGNRITYQPLTTVLLNAQVSYLHLKDQQNAAWDLPETTNENSYVTGDIGSEVTFNHSMIGILLSRQVRPVSSQELFGDRGLTLGNPELKAETAEGIDARYTSWISIGEWSLSAYYRQRHDAISASADSRGVIRYDNLSATEHYGVEATLDFNLTTSLSLRGNSGWHQQLVSEHFRPAFIGHRMPNQRTWDHYYSLQYSKKYWQTALAYTRQAGGFYDLTNLLAIPLRSQVDWWLSYSYADITLRVEANNITNNRVSDFYHYPVAGRNFAFKTSYRW